MAVLKNIVSKIFNLSTTPTKKTEGQFWYDTTNNVLKRSDGADYKPLAVGDNLISANSTDTVKGILDSKANYSDLTSYLPLTGGIIARAEENPDNPILTIQDTQYGFGWPMAGLLVKGGMYNDFTDDYDYYSTYIRPDEISGSAVVSTLGTSTTSAKLPTEGAVVKAISDVKTSLGSALTYEGSVENYSNLPTGLTTSDKGKVYNVVNANGDIPAGTNYAWNGTSWDALGGDLSAYQLKTDNSLTTTSKQIVGAINELNLKIDITTGPAPITSVYTVDSTVLEAFITDTQYANIQGRITISPSIDNIGAVYFGQSITDKSQAFPLYPGQIMSFSFTDINTFMCASDVSGDKFNYVVEFGVVNKDSIMDAGIIIRSAAGENYRLIPVTDETGAATLELERLV